MKKITRSLISCVCACALLTVPVVNTAFAAQHSTQGIHYYTMNQKAYEQMTDAEVVQKMKDMGISSKDIDYIMQLEYARRKAAPSMSLNGFPSNPEIGDYHTETYHVYFDVAVDTVTDVIEALVQGGVGIRVAILIASGILQNWLAHQDAKGVDVTVEYYYGPDNNGSVGWTPGYTTWSLFY
ncbi:conserved exported protein of unknown function [Ruminococcaceae bacterium BL-6]|nr:conserved exported protein of unknown function [Ruminococcaceae bacterium BL-6]